MEQEPNTPEELASYLGLPLAAVTAALADAHGDIDTVLTTYGTHPRGGPRDSADAKYRQALGIAHGEPLPKTIGQVTRTGARPRTSRLSSPTAAANIQGGSQLQRAAETEA